MGWEPADGCLATRGVQCLIGGRPGVEGLAPFWRHLPSPRREDKACLACWPNRHGRRLRDAGLCETGGARKLGSAARVPNGARFGGKPPNGATRTGPGHPLTGRKLRRRRACELRPGRWPAGGLHDFLPGCGDRGCGPMVRRARSGRSPDKHVPGGTSVAGGRHGLQTLSRAFLDLEARWNGRFRSSVRCMALRLAGIIRLSRAGKLPQARSAATPGCAGLRRSPQGHCRQACGRVVRLWLRLPLASGTFLPRGLRPRGGRTGGPELGRRLPCPAGCRARFRRRLLRRCCRGQRCEPGPRRIPGQLKGDVGIRSSRHSVWRDKQEGRRRLMQNRHDRPQTFWVRQSCRCRHARGNPLRILAQPMPRRSRHADDVRSQPARRWQRDEAFEGEEKLPGAGPCGAPATQPRLRAVLPAAFRSRPRLLQRASRFARGRPLRADLPAGACPAGANEGPLERRDLLENGRETLGRPFPGGGSGCTAVGRPPLADLRRAGDGLRRPPPAELCCDGDGVGRKGRCLKPEKRPGATGARRHTFAGTRRGCPVETQPRRLGGGGQRYHVR